MRARIYEIQRDDELIVRDGIETLAFDELQDACRVRGINCVAFDEPTLRAKLIDWLSLSTRVRVDA